MKMDMAFLMVLTTQIVFIIPIGNGNFRVKGGKAEQERVFIIPIGNENYEQGIFPDNKVTSFYNTHGEWKSS